jgi:hypothetical protein
MQAGCESFVQAWPSRARDERFLTRRGGTRFIVEAFSFFKETTMSVLSSVAIGWVTLNAALFAALMLRRPRPELRERLFKWVFHGASKPRGKSDRRSQHSHA